VHATVRYIRGPLRRLCVASGNNSIEMQHARLATDIVRAVREQLRLHGLQSLLHHIAFHDEGGMESVRVAACAGNVDESREMERLQFVVGFRPWSLTLVFRDENSHMDPPDQLAAALGSVGCDRVTSEVRAVCMRFS
jgi:hypothetical protein